ncbi:hypothetical protein [uncultured Fusobacterium sp.]|uniref:hypothetical protein n=1 Tax=uncultured Fusobacterium sp. TaxID=159267 RepID=UPI0015A5D7CE|nr:hypothetical protein [uncultured Fusobacterium sp.]
MDINSLPEYLKNDIEMVEKYSNATISIYDCYLDELWGSINSCLADGKITPVEAEELRQKFYWKNLSKGENC